MPLVVVYIGGGSASRLLVQRTVSRLRLLQINRLEFPICCTDETICLVGAPGLPAMLASRGVRYVAIPAKSMYAGVSAVLIAQHQPAMSQKKS